MTCVEIELRSLVVATLLAAGCGSEPDREVQSAGHATKPHADEPEHEALPKRLRLAPEVMAEMRLATAPATREPLMASVELPGEIVATPDRTARIAAKLSGTIAATSVQVGDRVAAGDELVRIRAPNLAELRSARASFESRAAAARSNAKRLAALVEKGMASDQEAIAARAEAEALESQARGAAEHLRAIGLKGGRGRSLELPVRSPITGIVTDRPVVVGDPVVAEQVVATIVNLDEVWFLARVFERDVPTVKPNAAAEVRVNAVPTETFAGTVAYLSHQVDPGARTLTARIPLVNRGEMLRLGLFGTAKVTTGVAGEPAGVVVSRSALTRLGDQPIVFVLHSDGDIEVHEVVIGREAPGKVEIVHGLHEGENVVVDGAFNLRSMILKSTFGEDE